MWFWRPQVALFVNEATLLPLPIPFAPAASVVERLPKAFAHAARQIGVDPRVELEAMSSYLLAKTASRSVIGIMNEFGHLAGAYHERRSNVDLNDLVSGWPALPAVPSSVDTPAPTETPRAPRLIMP